MARTKLEALPVHNGWTGLIVLRLANPHLLEGGKRSQNGATNPHRELALWWGNHFDLHGRRSQSSNLLDHPVGNADKHGSASRQNDVAVQIPPDINITLHDGVEGGVVDANSLHADESRVEQNLRAPEKHWCVRILPRM